MIHSDTGTLPGEHPYASVGSGPRALVVMSGFDSRVREFLARSGTLALEG